MTSREYAEQRYREALAQFATPGNRYNALEDKGIDPVYWGAAAGYSVEDIIDDAHAAGATGEHDRSADIRNLYPKKKQRADAWNAQTEAGGAVGSSSARRLVWRVAFPAVPKKPESKVGGGRVQRLIAGGFDIDGMEKLRGLSAVPVRPDGGADARLVSTEWQLLELFAPEEYAFMRAGKASAVKARLGGNLRRVKEWLDTPVSKTLGGAFEVVGANPHTGRAGASGSFGTKDTIAAYRHVVMEFDRMSLADQCRFWAGVIRRNALPLVCLVYSGNKSIHGLLRVDAKTAEDHREIADAIASRYAADENPAAAPDADFSKHPEKHPEYYRLDVQALRNPLVCVRLAGVVRKDTGKPQTLLYPCAAPTAAASGAAFVRRCAECAVRADCERAFGGYWGDKSHGGVGCVHPFAGWGEARRIVAKSG